MAPSNPSIDWSAMIPELLRRIAGNLSHCFDYTNFRLVCKSWLSVAPLKKFPPILILPSDPDSGELHYIDPADGGVHCLPLPEAVRHQIICGASRGWLAFMDEPTKAMSPVNPITGVQFPLPPVPHRLYFGLPHIIEVNHRDDRLSDDNATGEIFVPRFKKYKYIADIFLSSNPNSGAECIVVAKQRGYHQYVFCRLGDAAWTIIRTPYQIHEVVAFWNGRFYAVDRNEDVLAITFGSRDEGTTVIEPVMLPLDSKLFKLLECKGELLLVYVNLDDKVDPMVYKCDHSEGIFTWSSVLDSLADKNLFLSEFCYSGFLGHDLHGFKGNFIYHSKTGRGLAEDRFIQVMDVEKGVSDIISSHWPLQQSGSSPFSFLLSKAFCWFKLSLY